MSYEKQNFEDNQVLEASHLNHIEDGIIANEQAIENKQDKLVSGNNIKTINNQSLIGSGDITINPDLSGYATKEFVQTEIAQAQLDDKEIDLSGYATKEFVQTEISQAQLDDKEIDLSGYATKTELNSYATKTELNNKADKSHTHEEYVNPDLSKYATKTELSNKADKSHTHSEYVNPDLSKYQQKTDTNLKTSSKDLVGAINEVFQSGSNAKTKLVDALTANDVSCSTSESWDTIINKISNVGVKYKSGRITGYLQNYETDDNINFNIDCGFVPTILFLRIASVFGSGYASIQNIFVSNLTEFTINPDPRLSNGNTETYLLTAEIINLTETSFTIHIKDGGMGYTVVQFTEWYAIRA